MAKAPTPSPGTGRGRGGPQPNSGRPRAELTATRDAIDAIFATKVVGDLDAIYAAARDLALGHKAIRKVDGGEEEVYEKSPDIKAISYLIDRAAGKPRQAVESDAGPVDIRAAVEGTEAASAAYTDPDDDDGPDGDAEA